MSTLSFLWVTVWAEVLQYALFELVHYQQQAGETEMEWMTELEQCERLDEGSQKLKGVVMTGLQLLSQRLEEEQQRSGRGLLH